MAPDIKDILLADGPMLSSDLASRFRAEGASSEAIRKRISRVKPPVTRLKGLNFPNNEAFLFLKDEYGSSNFKEHLEKALISTGSSYGRALLGITARSGSVATKYLPIATGLPVRPTKGQILCSMAVEKLTQFGLLVADPGPDPDFMSTYKSLGMTLRGPSIVAVEDIMLLATRDWLVKAGFSSSNSIHIRTDANIPLTGAYAWDLSCPTYLSGIASRSSSSTRPGSIVCDIMLDRRLSLNDLKPFLAKCDSLIHQKREARLQPMVVADSFENDALSLLRSRGTFIARPEVILGADMAQDLRVLIDTIQNAAKAVSANPSKVFELIGRMSRLEGAALNLRGVVLELIMAHVFKEAGFSIEVRQKVRDSKGQVAEIDVMAASRTDLYVCECKGMAPGALVSAESIIEWEGRSLPRIKDWIKTSIYRDRGVEFRFYASTDYSEDAKQFISTLAPKHRKQPIKFLDGEDILKELRNKNEGSLIDIFREQFCVR